MNLNCRAFWTSTAALVLSACGYVGDPLYPALNIPNRVTDLTAVERGSNLELNFTIPPLTTEGLAVREIGAIDLRVGQDTSGSFEAAKWSGSATKIHIPVPKTPGPNHVAIPVTPFVGQDVIIAVRIVNTKGRASDWSNFLTVHVQPALATPSDVQTVLTSQGVVLKWQASNEPFFKIIRQAQDEPRATQIGTSTEHQYLDSQAQYGQTYKYWVQGGNGEAESDYAGPITLKLEDKFPPAVPVGLTAIAGLQTIELAWERNTEPDFKGYRVYRSTADAPFEKIVELIEAPSFSDAKVESGKHYRYVVSAVDQSGNESDKSTPVEATAP